MQDIKRKTTKFKNKKPLLNLKDSWEIFPPFIFFFPLTSGYNMQEVILSRQQSVTTAWNFSIILSQKKKKKVPEEVILVST